MNNCKKCGTPLDKGTSKCPICGVENPLSDQASSGAVDFTNMFTPVEPEFKLVKQKKRLVAALLGYFLGFCGAPLFYLGFKKGGLIWLIIAVVLGGLSYVAGFVLDFRLAFILGVSLIGLGNLIVGTLYAFPHDQKDARGEFLK